MTTVDDCRLVQLPRISRPEGNLTSLEAGVQMPFDIARVYYLYDIPGGSARGGHAHRQLEQLIIAVMGAFHVRLRDGETQRVVELNRAYEGLYIAPMIWRELEHFSSGAISVVLASRPYEESDYIRAYDDFVLEKRGRPRAPDPPAEVG